MRLNVIALLKIKPANKSMIILERIKRIIYFLLLVNLQVQISGYTNPKRSRRKSKISFQIERRINY